MFCATAFYFEIKRKNPNNIVFQHNKNKKTVNISLGLNEFFKNNPKRLIYCYLYPNSKIEYPS